MGFHVPQSVLVHGQLSDRYHIGTDTGCIISNRIGYFCIRENPILRAPLQVWQLLTGRITPASPWHQEGAVLGLGHQRQMTPHSSTSRQWWRQSQLSIIVTFLRINQS